MKQMSRIRRRVLSAGLMVGGLVGCATQSSLTPPPSAAQVNAAETAVKVAREAGTDGSPGQHVRLAEQQLAEARDRTAHGDNRGAGLALARAEVDAELSQVLRRREKALAEAEVMESQLDETRRAQPADPGKQPGDASKQPTGSAIPTPVPLPSTAPAGAVAPGPLPNDPLAGTTVQSATPATSLPTPATSGGSGSSGSLTPAKTQLGGASSKPSSAPSSSPPDPSRNSPPDNKSPTTAPGPSGPGTGIPTGPAGPSTASP
jgi:hypothetical protein